MKADKKRFELDGKYSNRGSFLQVRVDLYVKSYRRSILATHR